ncbi:hypothetical protein ACFC5X_20180 [Streptomyces sp. NPDC055952]|uniref:hypothetical protein n=1 Tax=Streptomyces sp. NPDC055952 TaxID=3345663 RepID=UPI0035DB2A15
MRMTRREMNELAADRIKCAARSEAAARDGELAAADPANSPARRAQARTAAGFARRHAQEYREEARALLEGRTPGQDW